MRPNELLSVFPEPQVYEDWMGGNLNDSLLFQGLMFVFSACDASAPLPDSRLISVIIFQRPDACLFGRFMTDWNKTRVVEALQAQGFTPETLANGDIIVPFQLSLSFDEEERLIWLQIP